MGDDKTVRSVTDNVFDKFDADGSGTLSAAEAKAALSKVTRKLRISVPESAIEQAIKAADTDGSGELDKEEFFQVAMILYLTIRPKKALAGIIRAASGKKSKKPSL